MVVSSDPYLDGRHDTGSKHVRDARQTPADEQVAASNATAAREHDALATRDQDGRDTAQTRTQAASSSADLGVQSAEPEETIAPEYPPSSVRRGHEGLVIIEARVRAEGTVASAHVVQSSSHPRLDRAARKAVLNARFRPATQAGRPVACTVSVPIRFSLR
jgi:protein TonB